MLLLAINRNVQSVMEKL